jgi:peptide/nickel transport system permease protein
MEVDMSVSNLLNSDRLKQISRNTTFQLIPLLKFLLKKIVRLVILLFAVSTISFILVTLSPIDPVDAYLRGAGVQVSPEQRELIAQRYGLNEPPPVRY